MSARTILTLAGIAGVVVLAGQITVDADPGKGGIKQRHAARETSGVEGPDMTFCQLYGLKQFGRSGDTVGLAEATTSWNIGGSDLMWFHIPDEEHPFIVMNLYRLKDDQFDQIGQSHIKHGFFALGNNQCGGPPCTYEQGHSAGDWLGTGCTDTYSANLNASQSGLGPRYEVNPWSGSWIFSGSHMQGNHNHNQIQHRLQVHDADLDPAQNAGASYYAEGYYVVLDDIDVMNSAAWKPVTVNGSPGGTWSFGMSGSGTSPETGFAIDAWTGATQTLVAEEIPVEEFVSPDGRCVLAAKATQLSENMWRYKYSLLNIDMDRQAGSFSVPIATGTNVSNVVFHSVEHHGEPFNTADGDAVVIDNAEWVSEVSGNAVTWSTTTNPLRWGTMYSFRFDANAPPAVATISTVGLFRTGSPTSLTAETTGPSVEDANTATPDGFDAFRGFLDSGNLGSVLASDDNYLCHEPGIVLKPSEAPVTLDFFGTLPNASPATLDVTIESSANTVGLEITVSFWNYNTDSWDIVGTSPHSLNADEIRTFSGTPADHVEPGTGEVITRYEVRVVSFIFLFPWLDCVDHVFWTITN